jgi:WD40 repeat protein
MKYRAFFSYSRADDQIANWLHRQLDGYRTPRAMVGEAGAFGPLPRKLHPIFRDRTDLEAGGHIDGALQAALENSEALIVLCTPTSAKSRWVDLECETFLKLGREARILPVIAKGEPDSGDPETECFPPSLRGRGLLAADLREIRQPDGRLIGDGRDAGRLKLIAGLLGVPLDGLTRREHQRQRTRLIAAWAAAALFGVLAVIAGVQTIEQMRQRAIATDQRSLAIRERLIAETERERAEFSVARFVTERGWARLEENNVAAAARYALLAGRQFPDRKALAAEVLGRIRREAMIPIDELAADGRVLDANWEKDGPRVLRLAASGRMESWRLAPKSLMFEHTLSQQEDVCAVSKHTALICGPQGLKRAVSLRDGTVSAKLVGDSAHKTAPVLSMEGRRAVSLGDGQVRVWDVHTGALIETQPFPTDKGGSFQLAVSADGATALALSERGHVLIWRVGALQHSHRFPEILSGDVSCRMATPTPWATSYDVGCENAEGYEDISIELRAEGYEVSSDPTTYGWRGDGPGNMMGRPEPMLSGPSFERRSPSAALNYPDFITRGETRSDFTTLTGDGYAVRLYPSGRTIVTFEDGGEREIATGTTGASLSPDRSAVLLVSVDGQARVYDLRKELGSPLARGRFSDLERSQPRGPAFFADGRYVAAMRNVDSEVLIIDTETGRSLELSTFDDGDEMFAGVRARNSVDRMLFHDGRIYATSFSRDIIHVWDPEKPDRRVEMKASENEQLQQQISKDGIELPSERGFQSSSPGERFRLEEVGGGGVLLRSTASGFALAKIEPIQNSPWRAAAFSADARRVATLSSSGEIAVWDLSVFAQPFEEGAAWVCANLLSRSELQRFSNLEIADDPLLKERGVDSQLGLCAR